MVLGGLRPMPHLAQFLLVVLSWADARINRVDFPFLSADRPFVLCKRTAERSTVQFSQDRQICSP